MTTFVSKVLGRKKRTWRRPSPSSLCTAIHLIIPKSVEIDTFVRLSVMSVKILSPCHPLILLASQQRTNEQRTKQPINHNCTHLGAIMNHHTASNHKTGKLHLMVFIISIAYLGYGLPYGLPKYKKGSEENLGAYNFIGASGGIRTPDPRLRRPLLYPTELLTRLRWSG